MWPSRRTAERGEAQHSNEILLNPANVNSSQFGLLFKVAVDDQIYAQPLYMANAPIAAGTHNLVFLATTSNSVYAFDADSGHLDWHRQLGNAFTIQDGGFTCKASLVFAA